jgi:SagB-type dehydrogenase family enzyme
MIPTRSPDQRGHVFRETEPVAWSFHRNTSYWPFNASAEVSGFSSVQQPPKEYPVAPLTSLPAPRFPVVDLEAALRSRMSCRRFSVAPVGQLDLGTLLAAAYGVQGKAYLGELEFLERPIPSGGGLYPLELYVLVRAVGQLEPGVYHYAPLPHALEQLRRQPLPSELTTHLFAGQAFVSDAAAVVVVTAVIPRSLHKYGDRGYRYLLMEAGHLAQNLNLVATALRLGTCNLGGFLDDDLAGTLGLDAEEEIPLYGMAIGFPTTVHRIALRIPRGNGFQ